MSTSSQFIDELDAEIRSALDRVGAASASGEAGPEVSIQKLLAAALKNELEAAEEAALWIVDESDLQVKLALMRQCGDEAKHYRLIAERLSELGADPAALGAAAAQGRSAMFEYLRSLETTVERIAAGPFAREALARVRNDVFIRYCEERGDEATARLYREIIQPDEGHHHELGRRLLARLARSEDDKARARAAARKVLAIAEELQETARLKSGLCRLPGC